MNGLFVKGLLMWLLFAVVATFSGILREKFLTPRLGSLKAHQVGTFAVLIVLFLLTYFFLGPALSEVPHDKAWMLGLTWLAMTVCFEFIFGHYVVGHSWAHLFTDYNILRGRIWGLFLLGITIFPRFIQILKTF